MTRDEMLSREGRIVCGQLMQAMCLLVLFVNFEVESGRLNDVQENSRSVF